MFEDWQEPQNILVMLAHPDDPEFFCGGTLLRWSAKGHIINYLLFTKGEKGGSELFSDSKALARQRMGEQRLAGDIIGVQEIQFLDFKDGYLMAGLEERKEAVRAIRKFKPDIVVSCDPTNLFIRENHLNHPDHLAIGAIVAAAVYPGAGNRLYFPDLLEDGLDSFNVKEIWFALPGHPNVVIDVTENWEKKIEALTQHQSQIGEKEIFIERMKSKIAEGSTQKSPRYEEKFFRVSYR